MPVKVTRNQLAPHLDALTAREGTNPTADPRVNAYRVSLTVPPTPTVYAASVLIVGQGAKRGHLGGVIYEYDASHCLLVTSPLPMLCEIEVRGPPVLTVGIDIDLGVLTELVSTLDPPTRKRGAEEAVERGIHVVPLTAAVEEAMVRLLRQLREPETARVLAPATLREVYYQLLRTPAGSSLRALVSHDGPTPQLDRVMRHM
ncbi:MAG: AraC family transcriptional regulator, partial [Myxococcales bacterium]